MGPRVAERRHASHCVECRLRHLLELISRTVPQRQRTTNQFSGPALRCLTNALTIVHAVAMGSGRRDGGADGKHALHSPP